VADTAESVTAHQPINHLVTIPDIHP
jgi:hypothetical protein